MDDEDRPAIWKYILAVGVALVSIGVIWIAVNAVRHQMLVDRYATVSARVEQTQQRTKEARAQWQANASKYADHWSTGLDQGLTAAELMFASKGELFTMLADANEAVARDDWQAANTQLDEIKSKLASITAVDIILGPPDRSKPGLYAQLADWTTKSDSVIAQAQKDLADVQTYLDGKKGESRAITDGVTFAAADSAFVQAKDQLAQAVTANTTQVERGIIDKALAYQLATQASAKCTDAKTAADTEVSAAYTAEDAVNAAQTRIDLARVTILSRTLNQQEALSALEGAASTLTSARSSFATHDFVTAKTEADEALAQAVSAEDLTVPTPTPQPVRSSGGSSIWIFGSGGSSGSSDSGSGSSGGSSGGSWWSSDSSSGGSDLGSGGSDFGGDGGDFGGSDSGGGDGGDW